MPKALSGVPPNLGQPRGNTRGAHTQNRSRVLHLAAERTPRTGIGKSEMSKSHTRESAVRGLDNFCRRSFGAMRNAELRLTASNLLRAAEAGAWDRPRGWRNPLLSDRFEKMQGGGEWRR